MINRVKVTEEAHAWVRQLIFKWCSWSILIIIHVLNSLICGCCNAHHCFAVPHFYLTQRPSFATGDEWSQNDWTSTTCMGTSIFPCCSWFLLIVIHILNSQICGCCNGHHCFAVPHSYLNGRPSFAGHWWEMELKWPKKHMYGYKQCAQWCSWSILIIIHVLNSQICSCCNGNHCFAVAFSYLTQRPLFANDDQWSQSDWRRTCMSANLFLNNVADLYWS
jgi:hypothetical protein